jgi:benzoyl-CoA reductase subunit C
MEEQLKALIEGNNETNRVKWAKAWKKDGKKVIGVVSTYVPEEIISAANILPFRITGTWQENISHARIYRSDSNCGFCNHILESVLNGDLDFLDGIVISDIDQDLVRLWDVLVYLKKFSFCHIIHVPFTEQSALNYQFYADEMKNLKNNIENFAQAKITGQSLWSTIEIYNKMRTLLEKMYGYRKREIPPLSGSETLGITTAAAVIPKEQFNKQLESLLPYIEQRKTHLKHIHPRLLVISDMLDNPSYLDLVEERSLVAMDDMDTGIRYFVQNVDTSLKDPIVALSKRYLGRHNSPRFSSWDKQADQIIKWVREYNIDGVLSLPFIWCYPQRYRVPFLDRKLEEAGIPHIALEREYHLANIGQLRTRIGAFLEMLDSKSTEKTSK